ncbi:hypothetical protein OG225_43220 (plasmid) [Nocardia sp. NBC_01377]|uniref:hypothetical protein n=1 Tax=Nocardia sp. NBC_01377 TaxID=2903595 RepID=UPI002F91870A
MRLLIDAYMCVTLEVTTSSEGYARKALEMSSELLGGGDALVLDNTMAEGVSEILLRQLTHREIISVVAATEDGEFHVPPQWPTDGPRPELETVTECCAHPECTTPLDRWERTDGHTVCRRHRYGFPAELVAVGMSTSDGRTVDKITACEGAVVIEFGRPGSDAVDLRAYRPGDRITLTGPDGLRDRPEPTHYSLPAPLVRVGMTTENGHVVLGVETRGDGDFVVMETYIPRPDDPAADARNRADPEIQVTHHDERVDLAVFPDTAVHGVYHHDAEISAR